MLWHKPAGMKYVDLCVYIDENIKNIAVPGENPEIETKIYNYLWLLSKCLAIKKRMFKSFQDYDGYAFHAANRLFRALRNNCNNQGKEIKGKHIVPIKSCLNYMKALLHPMKLEYQKETFNVIISEEYTSKQFDAVIYSENLKSQALASQTDLAAIEVKDLLEKSTVLLDEILKTSPFVVGTPEYKRVRISILLNAINDLITKNKLDINASNVQVWKLPKSMGGYLRILTKEFYTKLKQEIIECIKANTLGDAILTKLISPEIVEDQADYE